MTGDALENEQKSRGILRDVMDAVRGREIDYTKGNLNRAILLLSVPMILEMVMESIFAVVDVFFVSQLGDQAVAIVGLTEAVMTLVFAVAIGLAMATTAMVARRIGEKKPEAARLAAVQALTLGLLLSLPISFTGIVFADEILALMGGSPELIEAGRLNVMVMFGGNLTIILLFLINAIFRGAGNASLAMWVLWFSNGINIILDPCLIFGLGPFPEMGVAGAAIATNCGRGMGVLLQLYLLFGGKSVMRLRSVDLRLHYGVLRRLARVSSVGMVQWIITTSSWIILVRIVALFGEEALAGYTIGIRIIIFSVLPAWGLSNAAATLVGQNLGAGDPSRAEKSVWMTGCYNMLFMGALALVFIFTPDPLIRIFTDEPSVIAYGVSCLHFISYGYLFAAMGMVLTQAFNGAGDTTTPTLINLICHWGLQIPLAFILAVSITDNPIPGIPAFLAAGFMDMGPNGVYLAIAAGDTSLALLAAYIFMRGKWKHQVI